MVEKGTTHTPQSEKPVGSSALMHLRDEIDDLFENFGASDWFAPMRLAPTHLRRSLRTAQPGFLTSIPALDVIDGEKEIRLVADLPGMSENDIKIEVSNSTLTISGEKKEEKEEGGKEDNYYLCERRFGAFERTIKLPEGIEEDKIEASVKNGVLTVTMPKSAEAQKPRKTVKVKPAA